MFKHIFIYLQNILPTHLISQIVGCFANMRLTWFKNLLITQFIKIYKVDMHTAVISNPQAYLTFNDFFIRQLKKELRPCSQGQLDIVSPVDGVITQIGVIKKNLLLQTKNFYFDLEKLLGGDTLLAQNFRDGLFATFYLSPADYHRYHMPMDGILKKIIFVPGRLFSVNKMTAELIPQLYSRNERLICIFDTAVGQLAMVIVGAFIVGSIQTVWMKKPIRANRIITESMNIPLEKGTELGVFKLGSSVILLYEKDKIGWTSLIQANHKILLGQIIAKMHNN